jgi:hypothetical protein
MTLIEDIDRKWWAQVEYNTNLFRKDRITRLLSDYASILERVISDPEGNILSLPLPSLAGSGDAFNVIPTEKERKEKQRGTSPAAARSTSERRFKPIDREQEVLVDLWKEILGLSEVGTR